MVVLSLSMTVEYVDGKWIVDAPWLEQPVVEDTWFEAYYLALRLRP